MRSELGGLQKRNLSIGLAENPADVTAAQALRYRVFHEDMGARTTTGTNGLDVDPYDDVCDHLLVRDLAIDGAPVVGTYRLLRQSVADGRGGFYSAGEYDLAPMIRQASRDGAELLELGRSCVDPLYRDAGTIQLLWRGIADYLRSHRIGCMFGCASFPGIDPDAHAEGLSLLAHDHLAPAEMRARALGTSAVAMARLPIGGYDARIALRQLPPLIKAYLRVGAQVGEGAYIDQAFNTIDVFMLMPVAAITARYAGRFDAAA